MVLGISDARHVKAHVHMPFGVTLPRVNGGSVSFAHALYNGACISDIAVGHAPIEPMRQGLRDLGRSERVDQRPRFYTPRNQFPRALIHVADLYHESCHDFVTLTVPHDMQGAHRAGGHLDHAG